MALSIMFIMGFIGVAILLVIGLTIFGSVTSELEQDSIIEPETNSSWLTLIILIPITIMFVLPILIIFRGEFGFITKPIKKILISLALMVGIVKISEGNDKYR